MSDISHLKLWSIKNHKQDYGHKNRAPDLMKIVKSL